MTYGEYWFAKHRDVEMINGEFVSKQQFLLPLVRPQVMNETDALAYYSEKCRTVFVALGFEYNVADDFEDRLHVAIKEVRKRSKTMLKREIKKIRKMGWD